MAESWQSAWVEVLPDFQAFKNVATPQMGEILGSAGTAGGITAGTSIGAGMAGGIKKAAPLILGALAVLGIGKLIGDAIRSGISYALTSIDLASEMEQSTGAVEAVFKEHAGTIKKLAGGAATEVGLAASSYQGFAVIVGAQLKNLGVPFEDITEKSSDLISLGADLAAQFGGPTSDAVGALSSLLRGERDPIERYGVGIKQSDINARLAGKGLKDLTGEAKKQAEIQATLAILWEQTADAQGTFASESGTLAGQQQRLAASLEDSQTALGEALLPTMTELTKLANEEFIPMLNDLIREVGPELAAALKESAPAFMELLRQVMPLLPPLIKLGSDVLPPLFKFLGFVAEQTSGVLDSIANLFDYLRGETTMEEFRASVEDLSGWVGDLLRAFLDVQHNWIVFVLKTREAMIDFTHAVSVGISEVVGWLLDLPLRIGRAVLGIGSWLFTAGQDLIRGFIRGLQSTIGSIGTTIGNVMDYVAGFFPHSPAKYGPFSGAGWAAVAASGKALGDKFTSDINPQVDFGQMLPVTSVSQATATGMQPNYGATQSAFRGDPSVRLHPDDIKELVRGLADAVRQDVQMGVI